MLFAWNVEAQTYEVKASTDVCITIYGDYIFKDFEFNTETSKLRIDYGKCEEIGLFHGWVQRQDFLNTRYAEVCRNCKLIRERKDTEWIYLEEDKE